MNKPAKKPAVVAKTAPKKRGRPVGSTKKTAPVNWEKLAKQLQVALAGEMKDSEIVEELLQNYHDEAMRVRTGWERIVILFTGRV